MDVIDTMERLQEICGLIEGHPTYDLKVGEVARDFIAALFRSERIPLTPEPSWRTVFGIPVIVEPDLDPYAWQVVDRLGGGVVVREGTVPAVRLGDGERIGYATRDGDKVACYVIDESAAQAISGSPGDAFSLAETPEECAQRALQREIRMGLWATPPKSNPIIITAAL